MGNRIISTILLFFCIVLFSCKSPNSKKQLNYDNDLENKINKYFEGFPQLQIDQKYFNVRFGHKSFHYMRDYYDFRYDRFQNRTVTTSWVRTYIVGNKAYKEFRYYSPEDLSNNLLIISENRESAFLKWRNTVGKSKESFNTGDLDETTDYLETNLPAEIIKKFYFRVKCKINEVHPDSISINLSSLGPYYSPHLIVE